MSRETTVCTTKTGKPIHSYTVEQRDGKPVLVCRCGKEMR